MPLEPLTQILERHGLYKKPLLRGCLAEFCGTAILIIFGCGVLAQFKLAKLPAADHGNFQSVSWNWGMAVMLAVFFSGKNGHGNTNPAITLAFAVIGKVPWVAVPWYTLSQLFGAILGSLAVYAVNVENINAYVQKFHNGSYLTESTGNIFVTVPAVANWNCLLDQIMGTALLAAGALAIVDKRTWKLPDNLHPFFLGLLVFSLVQCLALNAGCALNPARDLGPRITIAMLGWKDAFTHGSYYFWIPIIGPYLGALIGALLYELTIGMHADDSEGKSEQETLI